MKKIIIFSLLVFMFISCIVKNDESAFASEILPRGEPLDFKVELIPDDKIIHKGTFSPDLKSYYYTISDKEFKKFNIYYIIYQNGIWSKPEQAFFNSDYDEHGMSFSPDGNTLYFSSTRPVNRSDVASTWHLWKSEKVDEQWSTPTYVDIPNLRGKLVSHPTITSSKTLYFHASNLDYSDMHIYRSQKINDEFKDAKKVSIPANLSLGSCTPFISPKEDYLIYASIGNQLDLMVIFNEGNDQWSNPKKLNSQINEHGQGNPYVTPDNTYLFYTAGNYIDKNWKIKWINIESELKTKNK